MVLLGLVGRVEDDLAGLGVDGLGVVSADEASRQLDGEAGGGLGVGLGEAVLDEEGGEAGRWVSQEAVVLGSGLGRCIISGCGRR